MIRTFFRAAALLTACSFFAATALAQQGPARAQLDRFSSGLDTLYATFEQQVIDNDGKVQDASSGQVWLSRPELFRWEYGGDFPELVVADGDRIWIYDEMLEQVTVKDQAAAGFDSPLTLLTDPSLLDQQFEAREVGEADGMQLLELKAREMETQFERLILGLKDDRLAMMIMEDAFGLRTEIRFQQIELNPDLDRELFTFTPPESADIIGSIQ
jgi:outer membrane lipoprotein carrier protein